MSLSKITLANKRARREKMRKLRRLEAKKEKSLAKIHNKRIRDMMVQGRKEHLARRREEVNYIKQLEEEISGPS